MSVVQLRTIVSISIFIFSREAMTVRQKLGRFDRLLSSRSHKKVAWERESGGTGDTITMKTSSTLPDLARSCFSFFFFRTENEMAERETELENSRRSKRERRERENKLCLFPILLTAR